jgi:hypothetical protein
VALICDRLPDFRLSHFIDMADIDRLPSRIKPLAASFLAVSMVAMGVNPARLSAAWSP